MTEEKKTGTEGSRADLRGSGGRRAPIDRRVEEG